MTSRSLLVTLTGRDRPGVSSALFDALEEAGSVLDVEQVTIHGRLTLAVLVTAPEPITEVHLRDRVTSLARELALECEILAIDSSNETDQERSSAIQISSVHVTVIGAPLHPQAMRMIADSIAACGGNIDRITRMADWPVTAIELETSGAEPERLRSLLTQEAITHNVDIAVQRGGLARRAKRLVVMDVDSTLIQDEVIDLLARRAGVESEVAHITEAAMNGEIDFAEALQRRVALLAGLPESILNEVKEEIRLTPGARTLVRTLQRLDHDVAVVSGGFIEVVGPIAEELGITYVRANSLEVNDGKLTGRIVGPIIDRRGKAQALRDFAETSGVSLDQCIAIGDGANDLEMISVAGLGIAFNAKQVVREQAQASLNVPYLDSVLYLLGIPRDLALESQTPRN